MLSCVVKEVGGLADWIWYHNVGLLMSLSTALIINTEKVL